MYQLTGSIIDFKIEFMACNFSIPFTGSAEQVLNKARSAVQGQGGLFEGDLSGGNFNVSVMGNTIRGSYSVIGQQMNIIISDKPFFVPCGTIEGFLKNQLT